MSTINLRLPESLHKAARARSRAENISIIQLITLALAEKISAFAAGEFIQKRAAHASRQKFEDVLAKILQAEPAAYDRLPASKKK